MVGDSTSVDLISWWVETNSSEDTPIGVPEGLEGASVQMVEAQLKVSGVLAGLNAAAFFVDRASVVADAGESRLVAAANSLARKKSTWQRRNPHGCEVGGLDREVGVLDRRAVVLGRSVAAVCSGVTRDDATERGAGHVEISWAGCSTRDDQRLGGFGPDVVRHCGCGSPAHLPVHERLARRMDVRSAAHRRGRRVLRCERWRREQQRGVLPGARAVGDQDAVPAALERHPVCPGTPRKAEPERGVVRCCRSPRLPSNRSGI